MFPISFPHMSLPCKCHIWETRCGGGPFREPWGGEGDIKGAGALACVVRARGDLLGQNQEAEPPGHIPFPLADELGIQDVGESREGHLLFIGSSDEHAESVPVVGQFEDVVVMAVGGQKLGCEDTRLALKMASALVGSHSAPSFQRVLSPPPPLCLEASFLPGLWRLP